MGSTARDGGHRRNACLRERELKKHGVSEGESQRGGEEEGKQAMMGRIACVRVCEFALDF